MRINELKALAKTRSAPGPTGVSPDEEKVYAPMFVPMGSPKGQETMLCEGRKVPVHVSHTYTRSEVIADWTNSKDRATIGAIYKSFFYACVATIACIISFLYINVYVAGVFAYIAGYQWSERLLNAVWSTEWFQGKSLIRTK